MKKLLLYGFGGLLLCAGAVAGYLYVNLDGMVQRAIEEKGTALTRTKVTVASVRLSPFSGQGVISGLRVANPPGYAKKNAVEVDSLGLKLQLKSLRTPVVVVDSIVIDGPRVDLEANEKGINITRLQKNIESSEAAQEKQAASGEAKAKPKKLIIGLFRIDDGKFRVQGERAAEEGRTLTLDKVELRQIGRKKGGVPAAVATKQIAKAVVKSASEKPIEAARQRTKDAAKGLIRDSLDQLVARPGEG
jgi:hypothetical protein